MKKALAVGILAAVLDYLWLTLARYQAHDFTWPWQAARLLISGHNPYTDLHLAGGPAFADPFFYPLPAAIIAMPLSFLPAELAGALWAGLGAGVLSYAIFTRAPHLWPMLLSAPFIIATRNAQWAPLLIGAAMLSPYALGLAAAKPTLGIALWVCRPSWKAAPLGLALVVASFALLPTWPLSWLANAHAGGHQIPILTLPFGPLLLLGLLRWRRARLLLVLVCMPQMLYFYDQLPVFLSCRDTRFASLLCALSWLAYLLGPWAIIPLIYLPALLHTIQAEERAGNEIAAAKG